MLIDTSDIWTYDGHYYGFLCCVHQAFKTKKLPAIISTEEGLNDTLFTGKEIVTNQELALKLDKRLTSVLSKENKRLIQKGFWTTLENKEWFLIKAIEFCLNQQDSLASHTYQPAIHTLVTAIRQLDGEVHRYEGFTRFSEVNQTLVATIAPCQFVLPLLLPFFAERFPTEHIMIYDKTHHLLGQSAEQKLKFETISDLPKLNVTDDEKIIQTQWQTFFTSVAIKERLNPNLQLNQMPKRFWSELTEMSTLL